MNPSKIEHWVKTRRDIHAHPELRYEENRTADIVANRLHELGYQVETGIGKTGVVGVMHGTKGTGKSIGLRADMDALPIQERNEFPHASRHPGKMHACGHDGHVAMLLGAAQEFSENRNFAGSVVLIFQPAEEGGAGAQRMIEDGLFDRFPCDAVFAAHNMPGYPVGKLGFRAGPFMASADQVTVTIHGVGGPSSPLGFGTVLWRF